MIYSCEIKAVKQRLQRRKATCIYTVRNYPRHLLKLSPTNVAIMNMDGVTNHIAQAVHDKKPVPEIDFTLHTMEDGNQVSTQERVCKGMTYP